MLFINSVLLFVAALAGTSAALPKPYSGSFGTDIFGRQAEVLEASSAIGITEVKGSAANTGVNAKATNTKVKAADNKEKGANAKATATVTRTITSVIEVCPATAAKSSTAVAKGAAAVTTPV